jgi:hypothetical protein
MYYNNWIKLDYKNDEQNIISEPTTETTNSIMKMFEAIEAKNPGDGPPQSPSVRQRYGILLCS